MGAPAFRFYNYLKWARCRRSERLSETMPTILAASIVGSANAQCSRGRTPDVDTTQWFPRMSTGLRQRKKWCSSGSYALAIHYLIKWKMVFIIGSEAGIVLNSFIKNLEVLHNPGALRSIPVPSFPYFPFFRTFR